MRAPFYFELPNRDVCLCKHSDCQSPQELRSDTQLPGNQQLTAEWQVKVPVREGLQLHRSVKN
jgi:hypothetical protein